MTSKIIQQISFILLLSYSFVFVNYSHAQTMDTTSQVSLACLDIVSVQIGMNENKTIIFPKNLLKGSPQDQEDLLLAIDDSLPFDFFTFKKFGSDEESNLGSNTRPPGIYTYTIRELGNPNSCWGKINVSVNDGELPIAVCNDQIEIDISQQSTLTIQDINAGSFDIQTSAEDLQFAIDRLGETIHEPGSDEYGTQSIVTFTNADVCSITFLTMAVFDQDGNSNQCLSKVSILSPLSDCAFSSETRCFDRTFYVSTDNNIRVSSTDLTNDRTSQYILEIENKADPQNGIDYAFFSGENIGSYTYKLTNTENQKSCEATIEIKDTCPDEDCPNTLTVEDKVVQPSEAFCVNISGDFQNGLGALQTAIRWNPNILKFKRINKGNFEMEIQTGNLNQDEGYVPVTFLNSLLDESVKKLEFEICFIAREMNNVSSPINIDRGIPGLAFEASSVSPVEVVPVDIMNGTIIVGDPALIPAACNIEILCQNLTKECGDELTDIQVPEYTSLDNCGSVELVVNELRRVQSQNGCGQGSVSIEYYIDLDGSNDLSLDDPFCKSIISLNNGEVFDPISIRWPASVTGETVTGKRINSDGSTESDVTIQLGNSVSCLNTNEIIYPSWCSASCGLVGTAYEDEIVNNDQGASTSIQRKWTIIDWCIFDPLVSDTMPASGEIIYIENLSNNSSCIPDGGSENSIYAAYDVVEKTGIYSFKQYINIEDNTAPSIFQEFGQDPVPTITSNDDPDKIMLTLHANDFCLGELFNTESIVWNIDIIKIAANDQEIMDIDPITQKGKSAILTSQDFSTLDELTLGFKINAIATDAFGNSSSQVSFLVVVEGGENACWSFDQRQCGVDDFSVSIDASSSEEDMAADMKSYLDSVSIPTISVSVVKDFNQIVCEACTICPTGDRFFIKLLDASDQSKLSDLNLLNLQITDCSPDERPLVDPDNLAITVYPVSDKITDIGTFNVNNEVASFLGQSTFSVPMSVITQADNKLEFIEKSGQALNGISTFDIVLLQKMILGLDNIDYMKAIAGDVDKSGDITFTNDVVLLRKLVFGIESQIPGGNYFITSRTTDYSDFNAFDFTNNYNQHSFSEADIDPMKGIEIDIHKYGDLNNNFAFPRSDEKAVIHADNSYVTKNEIISINLELKSDDLDPYVGIQFGLDFKGLKILNVIHDYGSDLKYHLSENNTNLKLISSSRELKSKQSFIITMQIKANSAGHLSNMISIDELFKTEYITSELEVMDIDLKINNNADQIFDTDNIEEIKAYPNPAKEAFTISVPSDLIGTQIQIYNTTGQLEYSNIIESQKVLISKANLNSGGIKIVKLAHDQYLKVTVL